MCVAAGQAAYDHTSRCLEGGLRAEIAQGPFQEFPGLIPLCMLGNDSWLGW